MRKINKDFNNAPSALLNCAKKQETNLLENKNVNSNCYKKSREQLEKQFYEKCAYCETEYLANSDTWIEHYRPKSEYYWLAYEWSNLLPTCTKCNRNKRNYFPLINKAGKIKKPPLSNGKLDTSKCKADTASLLNEQAFVLHPKIDNPKDYLDFRINSNCTGIEIIGKDQINHDKYQGRGDATIKICDLNRSDLIIDRYKKVILEIIETFEITFRILQLCEVPLSKYERAFNIDFDKIKQKANQSNLEHTLLRKIIISKQKFEEIVCQAIENETIREFIMIAYRKY